ncbi:MAG: aminotransferase class III-fold pyridoxal phosphate-dependent enzyme [Acidobacteria bacterium]|nr:aminotransferase class III-fold pyridoxal phosphate-dependent enzyme [Acidobacteriota bacterium]
MNQKKFDSPPTRERQEPNFQWLRSLSLLKRASRVTSSERVDLEGTFPMIMEHAEGAYVWDVDGNSYLDFTASTGAIILGYRHPEVDAAVVDQILRRGTIFPTIAEMQVRLAERLNSIFPCAERVLFFRTGSCATTAAIRLARVFTGRSKVLTSGYHGWHDWHLHIFPRFEFKDENHLDFRYNLNFLEALLLKHRGDVACIIITPEPNFFGPEYLQEIREITKRENVLLIFDEVMSGFRYGRGGIQARFDIKPDLAAISKGLANGLALSAVLGRADIMRSRDQTHLAGTFHNELSSMAAALTTIEFFERERVYEHLDRIGTYFLQGMNQMFADAGMPIFAGRFPSLFHIIFEVEAAAEVFYAEALARGILMHPFDPQMITYAHNETDIDMALEKLKEALQAVRRQLPELFCFPHGQNLSTETLDFRTLHEFGGTIRYRAPINEIAETWLQVDR